MSVVRVCYNKELAGSCIYCCDGRYCTNTELVTYDWLDGFCTGYVDREALRERLKSMWRKADNGKYYLMP